MELKCLFSDKEQYKSITKQYQLSEEVDRGSSAMLFKHSDTSIIRLSTNENSHRLLIEGAKTELRFPKLIEDFGCIRESEIEAGGFYLGIFEKCSPLCPKEFKYLESILEPVMELLGDDQAFLVAETMINKNYKYLNTLGLFETFNYVLKYAHRTYSDLDFNLTNLMLNQNGEIVVTDLVN